MNTQNETSRHSFRNKSDSEIRTWVHENARRLYDRFTGVIVCIEIFDDIDYNNFRTVIVTYEATEPYFGGN